MVMMMKGGGGGASRRRRAQMDAQRPEKREATWTSP